MNRRRERLMLGVIATGLAITAFPALGGPQGDQVADNGHVAQQADNASAWVVNEQFVDVPGTDTVIRTWDKVTVDGGATSCYAISRDGGETFSDARETSYQLLLSYGVFDPIVDMPAIRADLQATDASTVHIVQFICQPMEEFRSNLADLGATIHKYIGNHGFVVEMSDEARADVESLPYVRWVGKFHPAYKTNEHILNEYFPMGYAAADANSGLRGAANDHTLGVQPIFGAQGENAGGELGENDPQVQTFNIMVFERGPRQKHIVADAIRQMGGRIDNLIDEGFLLRATLSADQLVSVLALNEVAFVDLWGPPEEDMNNARTAGGAVYLETLGFTGQGVRAEVMDGNVRDTHVDFSPTGITFHGPRSGDAGHGTPTSGIVYGAGIGNSGGTGMLPDAEARIFADYGHLTNRYTHTAELVDPNGSYRAVLQSNSWGDPRTRSYNTVSSQMDDILFINDIIICQSQSNAGNQDSRPQAWAKNIVSVGGFFHYNTLTTADDCWCFGGSTGPAADGRIGVTMTGYYDSIYTTDDGCDTCYTSSFGGTSGATPIVAGHFGLLFQMWHEGIWDGFGGGSSVFESRPGMATAKALMINGANEYDFTGSGDDLSRYKQGWGFPDLQALYDRAGLTFIVDETDPLGNLESASYDVEVVSGEGPFRATMVYTDPAGVPFSSRHRINDLSLKVTDPQGTVYWGNNGLIDGNFSTSGGSHDELNTEENVFVENPTAGTWTVEVVAHEVNEDAVVETPETDADYALVVSPVAGVGAPSMRLSQPTPGFWGRENFLSVSRAEPGEKVQFVYSLSTGSASVPGCPDLTLDVDNPKFLGKATADSNGDATLGFFVPSGAAGRTTYFQAGQLSQCSKSNRVGFTW